MEQKKYPIFLKGFKIVCFWIFSELRLVKIELTVEIIIESDRFVVAKQRVHVQTGAATSARQSANLKQQEIQYDMANNDQFCL